MKYYYETESVMRSYIKEQDKIIKEELNFTDEEKYQIFKILKTMHQNKDNEGIKDTILYNYFRNKPIFYGINRMRQDNFEREIGYYTTLKSNSLYPSSYYKEITVVLKDNKRLQVLFDLSKELLKEYFKQDQSELKTVSMINKNK